MRVTQARLAIVGALQEELQSLLPHLSERSTTQLAGRRFHIGRLAGVPAVLALSGVGKVSAATTAALLLDRFEVGAVVFAGVAGGLAKGVHVGHVVVARELLQHDLDASPLFPRYEVPLTGRSRFPAHPALSDALADAARAEMALHSGPGTVHEGLMISGDQFIGSAALSQALNAQLPDALAVEMEGAALAQVCHDFDRPFAVMRVISDRADDVAHVDFISFITDVAANRTHDIVLRALPRLAAVCG